MEDLISCIETDQAEKFAVLLSKKPDPASVINQTFRKKDPKYPASWIHNFFSYSCLYGNIEICKYLVSKGADPVGDWSVLGIGFPLAIAVLHSQFHVADWLQKTYDMDCSVNDFWPLMLSVEYGVLSGVKYALEHISSNRAPDRALWWATSNGHSHLVEYLLSKGISIRALSETELEKAIQDGHFKLVEKLLDCGIELGSRSWSILQELIERDQLALAAKAVGYGANVDSLSPEDRQKLEAFMLSRKTRKPLKL